MVSIRKISFIRNKALYKATLIKNLLVEMFLITNKGASFNQDHWIKRISFLAIREALLMV